MKIFATDVAADAIAFARRGLYPENVLNDLPEEYRIRFFERVDQGYQGFKDPAPGRHLWRTGHQPGRTVSAN